MKIGIVGNGFVGGATALFAGRNIKVSVYDINPAKCSLGVSTLKDLLGCEIIFICLPTPMKSDGQCHTALIEDCIRDLNNLKYNKTIVVRSTVPVGFCEKHKVGFMPEFLTEANWQADFVNNQVWILAGNKEQTQKMECLIWGAFNNKSIKSGITLVLSTSEAEMLKYIRNCFLATKVSFFNEIYQFCQQKGLDYETVMWGTQHDERIGVSHTKVPGPDGRRGYGGSCFVKDMASLLYQFKEAGVSSYIIDAVIKRNNEVDRPEKDWQSLVNRAVI